MRKLKEGFRKVFLTAMVISLCFASCKQPQNDSKVENITVAVQKGPHVKKALASFTLEKGSKLGFTEIKKKLNVLELDTNCELSKISLNNDSGKEITDSSPHVFNENTTIFISASPKGEPTLPQLLELKVDEKNISVADIMDAGKTKKEKVLIEAKASPADATIDYEPALVDGFWKLILGKDNQLKIKVKKGSGSKEYTLNIERLDADAPILKKLTVGKKTKEGAEITREMMFTAFQDANEVDVKAETDPEDAPITFSPALSNGKLTLSGDETTLTITVGVAPKTNTYTVKVKRLLPGSDFVNALFIYGGRKQGVATDVEKTEIDKVLSNKKDVVLEVAGPKATILAASKLKKWTSFKINGVAFQPFPYQSFTSASLAHLMLPAKGEELDVKIEIEDITGVGEFNFKIKRTNETVDVPVDKLYIREKNVLVPKIFAALHDENRTPRFEGAEPSRIEIVSNENAMKSSKINGTNYDNVIQKTDENNKPIWIIEGSVSGVQPSGKDVTLVVEPIDTDSYHSITWTFRLDYKAAEVIGFEYEINGINHYYLPPKFVQGIKSGDNPLIELKANFLNIKLSCGGRVANVKINEDEIQGDKLVATGLNYVLTHSIPIDTTEKQIDIQINPADLSVHKPVSFRFKATGDGTVEKIKPTFEEISGDKNLPKATFLDKLVGTEKPLYQTAFETADIIIDLSKYSYEFLCKEVKINGEKTEITVVKRLLGSFYKIKKSIPVDKTTPTDVKIEFIANEGKADNLTWQFQVQGGGIAPSLPQKSITIFKINDAGSYYKPLPKEFIDHLTDGKNPIYEFDGKKALVEVGSYNTELIENVIFKLDDAKKHEMAPAKYGYTYTAKYEFKVPDTEPHNVELIIKPKDKRYSELIYKFRLKSSGNKIPLPIVFGIDGVIQKNGYKTKLKVESVQLSVQAQSDLMLEVSIGEEGYEEKCDITSFKASGGKTVWEAKKDVYLLDISGNVVEKTFVIKVKPKNAEDYEETVCRYILTGTKIPNDNAEFVWSTDGYARVLSHIEWMAGLENNQYIDDYGVKAVTLKAYTISSRAKVKYQIVDMEDKPIAGQEEKVMTNTSAVHKSEKIELFKDKPTRIKAWVIAADGTTTNGEKGVWRMTYNFVPLAWEYENKGDKGKGAEYKKVVYDLIEIEKDKVTDPSKKIYLVFAPWQQADGYGVINDSLPQEQTPFINIGYMGEAQEYYKTTVDVSKLLDDSVQELKATLKMKKNGIDCLTYNVKIKVKQP